MKRIALATLALTIAYACESPAQLGPTKAKATEALLKAVRFYHEEVATHGGYVYKYSADLSLREAEGIPGEHTIWIQPPGTPAVAEAFMDAYEVTKNAACAKAALDAAKALVATQLHSGGWFYSAHFDAESRAPFFYRRTVDGEAIPDPTPEAAQTAAGGWSLWKQGKYRGKNTTVFDDNVTQSALRLLARVDKALDYKDEAIHDAAVHGLTALLHTQYPNGGWSANFDRFPKDYPSEDLYPTVPSAYPESWPRDWPKDFSGCYVTNDELMANMTDTLIQAVESYPEEDRYLTALKKAVVFMILAQMPDPQPAWAQQYNADMHPVWDRAFEPPAISGRESQGIMEALLKIYAVTGEKRFLEPVPKAIEYLRNSRHEDGTLSRYYELETNRPIYFTRGPGGKGHEMTYERKRLASNYGWIIESRLDDIEADYRALVAGNQPAPERDPDLGRRVSEIIEAMDSRGAWTEDGWVRDAEGKKTDPEGGIILSQTFIDNVATLVNYLASLP